MGPAAARNDLWSIFETARIYDLAQPLGQQTPVSPNHPGFKMALQRRHGDKIRMDGGSAASEIIVMGGHSGTHIDALCHVSHNGCLYGGVSAEQAQIGGLFSVHGVETIAPIFCRGVMLDIPALMGVEVLSPGLAITAEHLDSAASQQGLEIRPGDVVLVRSGWPKFWADHQTFLGLSAGAPGPDEGAARWLASLKIRATGGETIAYECIPPGRGHDVLPVHRVLLVENGIQLIEVLNLTELSRDKVWEFLFVLLPIKVVGATGIPVRPVAVVA